MSLSMPRSTVKTAGAFALRWTGTDRLIGALTGAGSFPLIVGYHRVVEDFGAEAQRSIPAMLISRRMLERHLDWIGHRYRFVSLDELGASLAGGDGLGTRVAAVTFDDGYRDVYRNAFPLLKRKGIPAAVFVVTDLVGTARPQIHDALYRLLKRGFSTWVSPMASLGRLLARLGIELPRRKLGGLAAVRDSFGALRLLMGALSQSEVHRLLGVLKGDLGTPEPAQDDELSVSWEMLSEMASAGITVGSHTRSHALLTHESPETVEAETAGSKRDLEKRLGTKISHLSYPDGRFNGDVLRAVATADYGFAYTICRHRDAGRSLLTIPRRFLWENSSLDALGRFSSAVLGCQANGVFDFPSCCGQAHR